MKMVMMMKCMALLLFLTTILALAVIRVEGKTRYYDWKIEYKNVTRLCHKKTLVSVNKKFPGPTARVREGDRIIINVTNLVDENITIHWHGVRQLLSAWADGPAYITQCPIQKGHSYVHNFTILQQRGTLFWHAHVSWLRATVYGGIIIKPPKNYSYPFEKPAKEIPIILGEWWNANPEDVINQAINQGRGYNISNALTINGQPGALYNCSLEGTEKYKVEPNKTYLLRLINAAMNFELYFSVTNHSLTIVEADAEYTEPYTTDVVLLAPGQTTNVLLTTNQPIGRYFMAASVHSPAPTLRVPFPTTPTTAVLIYEGADLALNDSALPLPTFPVFNDTGFALKFLHALTCLSFSGGYYYMDVPEEVDESLLYTVGYSTRECPPTANAPCLAPGGKAPWTSISNISFNTPTISLMQAYYNHINGVYESDFPDYPGVQYNYTGFTPNNTISINATKVKVLAFNTSVQIVFQNTATLLFESHPMHLHGQNFWIVGSGEGTFNSEIDTPKFDLKNPPSRNTVAMPAGGWVAIRWRAQNPGVWFLHCHLDIHSSWGMMMAFIVLNGKGASETLPPPPSDLPQC